MMLAKTAVIISCLCIVKLKCQFFDSITVKIYLEGVPQTLLSVNGIDNKNVTEVIIENEYIPVLKSKSFKSLRKLKYIYIPENEISTIENFPFEDLPAIRIINLNFNNIKKIGKFIFWNLAVSKLYLKGNGIEELETLAFYNLTNLETLDLSSNGIEILPRDLFELTENLKIINLSFNHLKNIEESYLASNFKTAFTNLVENDESILDLSDNNFTYVDYKVIKNVGFIKKLSLSNNDIKKIDNDAFKGVYCTNTINLEGNNLNTLSYDILKALRDTENIILTNNPWNISFVCNYGKWSLINNKLNTIDIHCNVEELRQCF